MSLFESVPDILDVTLRDGSYLIDFQFTAEDTLKIAAALEAVGFRWIEVGHGLGLSASKAGKGQAAADDEEYLVAAAQALQNAKWGMFCIPGIARLEDLDLAARYNMSFVRIGANITDVEQARPFIEHAKGLGLIVCFNAMKSYAVSPVEFARSTAQTRLWGADIIYLVDSAGGMFPEDVADYLNASKQESEGYLGFHGHDNLAMAMANTLQAIDCGAVLVDASLQGMGRSAGNTITEPLVAILKQRNQLKHIDLYGTMDVGQGLIRPFIQGNGLDPMAITSGYTMFHSSFTAKVKHYANKYDLDVRDVIVQLTHEDLVNAPDELLERIGQDLATAKVPRVISIPSFSSVKSHVKDPVERLKRLVRDLTPEAMKRQKVSALNIVMGETQMMEMSVSANIQHTPAHVVGSVTLTEERQLKQSMEIADGKVDIILLDVDSKAFAVSSPGKTAQSALKKTTLLTYSDSTVSVNAAEDHVVRLLSEVLDGMVTIIIGDAPKCQMLALRLAERLSEVVLLGTKTHVLSQEMLELFSMQPGALSITNQALDDSETLSWIAKANIVVDWTTPGGSSKMKLFQHIRKGTIVLDAGMGSISSEDMAMARSREAVLVRINIWPALSGALEATHESYRANHEDMGWAIMNGVPVVAGGAIGDPGDVVIDSIKNPTRVIGLVGGYGRLCFEYDAAASERIKQVTKEINNRQLKPRT